MICYSIFTWAVNTAVVLLSTTKIYIGSSMIVSVIVQYVDLLCNTVHGLPTEPSAAGEKLWDEILVTFHLWGCCLQERLCLTGNSDEHTSGIVAHCVLSSQLQQSEHKPTIQSSNIKLLFLACFQMWCCNCSSVDKCVVCQVLLIGLWFWETPSTAHSEIKLGGAKMRQTFLCNWFSINPAVASDQWELGAAVNPIINIHSEKKTDVQWRPAGDSIKI